jgi:hypothetical protein
VASVKVDGSEDAIRAAAQRFLQQQQSIVGFPRKSSRTALRAIVGRMSVEDIIRDPTAFAGQVAVTDDFVGVPEASGGTGPLAGGLSDEPRNRCALPATHRLGIAAEGRAGVKRNGGAALIASHSIA